MHKQQPTDCLAPVAQVQLGTQPAGQRRQLRAQRREARIGVGHGQRDRARQLGDGVAMGLVDNFPSIRPRRTQFVELD